MRVTSDLFVSALLRRVFADGGYAAVLRKGAEAAGAIFIRVPQRNGLETLFAPAPQSMNEPAGDTGRSFERRLMLVEPQEIEALLAREMRFDSDCWIVEIETEAAERYLDIVAD